MTGPSARLRRLRARQAEMITALELLVDAESPSGAPEALASCAARITELFADRLGRTPEQVGAHLQWSGGQADGPRVLLVGHYDTVWPLGTLARHPFTVADGRATGPGSFDMKAGIVQLVEALATLDDLSRVTVLLTADEELGSQTSRQLVQDAASRASAALILEPSVDGMLKTARKGTGMYTLRVTGRAAHAGLEPEKGANALVALAEVVLTAARLGRPELGTTVTPTMAAAGSASNVVPAEATAELDVRTAVPEEASRVDADVRRLATTVAGTQLSVEGGPNRPPMPSSASAALFLRAQSCAARLGIGPLGSAAVGGGSDGNFTAAAGTPTLDGLGAVGGGAHGVDEHVLVATMPERAALVAELIDDLLAAGAGA